MDSQVLKRVGALQIKFSDIPGAGRGLFSLCQINKGSLIFTVPDPTFSIVGNRHLDTTCDNCFRSIDRSGIDYLPVERRPRRCFRCNIYWYCNELCRDQAASHHHELECQRLREANDCSIFWTIGSNSEDVAEASDLCEDSRLLIRLASFVRAGQLSAAENQAIKSLMSSDSNKSVSSISRCVDKLVGITGLPENFIMSTATMIQNNWIQVYQPSLDRNWLTPNYDSGRVSSFCTQIGTCLEAYVGMLNHSCDANAIPILQGSELQIRAVQDIPAGSEIFLNYGVEGTYKERQEGLKSYGFVCTCNLCAQTSKSSYSELEKPILARVESWSERRKLGPKSIREFFESFLIVESIQNLDASSAIWPLRDLYYDIYRHLFVSKRYILALKTLLRIAFVIEPNAIPRPTPAARVDTMRSLVAIFHFICNNHSHEFADGFLDYLSADMELCLICITYQLRHELLGRLEECVGYHSEFVKSQRMSLETGDWVDENYNQDPRDRECISEVNYSCYSAAIQCRKLFYALMEYAQADS